MSLANHEGRSQSTETIKAQLKNNRANWKRGKIRVNGEGGGGGVGLGVTERLV